MLRVFVDQRTDDRCRITRVTDRDEFGRADESSRERVVQLIDDDHARYGGAFLPGVTERALHDGRDRVVEIGVGVHDCGVLAAHLHHDLFHVPLPAADDRGALHDVESDRPRTGERHERDVGVLDEGRPDVLTDAGEERQGARRQTGLQQDLDQAGRDPRRLLGRFQHDRVAGDERGRDHSRRDGEWEVPRCDHDAHPTRLIPVGVRLAGRLLQRRTFAHHERSPAVVLAEVDRFAHVRVGFGQRLARFEDAECRELVAAAAHLVAGAKQHCGAVSPRRRAPHRTRVPRRGDRGVDVGDTRRRAAAHGHVGAAGIDRHDHIARLDRDAVDQ